MSIQENILGIDGLCVLKPELVNNDLVIYSKDEMICHKLNTKWVQEITAHFQKSDTIELYSFNSSKMVRVITGSVYHFFYDMREKSFSTGKQEGLVVTSNEIETLYIPSGIAHGMVTLSSCADVIFSLEQYYDSKLFVKINDNNKFIDSVFKIANLSDNNLHYIYLKNMKL